MKEELVIVFARKPTLGKVKTRLAVKLGDQKAYDIYKKLLEITEDSVRDVDADIQVYLTEKGNHPFFSFAEHFVQEGKDLGESMMLAFKQGFDMGYKKIVLIGSDLPDMKSELLSSALNQLETNDLVFGPAVDGGYYLIGMKELYEFPFINKPWSTSLLYTLTKNEVKEKRLAFAELPVLNDIDSPEDYMNSSISLD